MEMRNGIALLNPRLKTVFFIKFMKFISFFKAACLNRF